MFRELCDVVEENSVEKLLDEIGCPDEKNNLISTPASDMVCVRLDNWNEGDLQPKPK